MAAPHKSHTITWFRFSGTLFRIPRIAEKISGKWGNGEIWKSAVSEIPNFSLSNYNRKFWICNTLLIFPRNPAFLPFIFKEGSLLSLQCRMAESIIQSGESLWCRGAKSTKRSASVYSARQQSHCRVAECRVTEWQSLPCRVLSGRVYSAECQSLQCRMAVSLVQWQRLSCRVAESIMYCRVTDSTVQNARVSSAE